MTQTSDVEFVPIWDRERIQKMSDDELIEQYQAIKKHVKLVDPIYLTEISARRLLDSL